MQVTHVQDQVTHAVITGNQTQSFGISDSPEFFHVLSSTLYSDKPRAVVRETLCNAWDSHIQSGKTNIPVIVTLTRDGEFTIKDSGPGIHPDDMHAVYCVYGNSTKKHDGNQTGGFGLGCKAPYAVVDHFDVDSCHMGVKSIYKMSKSSGEIAGKPGMTKIVSIPTTDTGLTVKMKIPEYQYQTYRDLIIQIASNGGMNVVFNDVPVASVPFDQATEGFLISRKMLSKENIQNGILVRYGNVIYPVPEEQEYLNEYREIKKILEAAIGSSYNVVQQIVFLAKPHTISVTPSRESLSLTDYTKNTLKELFQDFLRKFASQDHTESMKLVDETIEFNWSRFDPCSLLSTEKALPGISWIVPDKYSYEYITKFSEITRSRIRVAYPKGDFRYNDLLKRLRMLEKSGFGNRGLIQTFIKEYIKDSTRPDAYYNRYPSWLHRRVIGPILTEFQKNKLLSADRLLVYGPDYNEERKRGRRFSYSEDVFTPARTWTPVDMESVMPFLRNIVILTHSRTDISERVPNFPAMQRWFGAPKNSLVYVVQRSDDRIQAARDLFKSLGMYVIDATVYQQWETPKVKAAGPKKDVRKKPKGKGIPALSNILNNAGNIHSTLFKEKPADDVVLIEKPEFIIKIPDRTAKNFIDGIYAEETKWLVRAYGHLGGICVSTSQYDKYKAIGCKTYEQFIFDKLLEEVKGNPGVRSYIARSLVRADKDGVHRTLLEILQSDDELSAHYKIQHTATQQDLYVLKLINQLNERYYYKQKEMKAVNDEVAKIALIPEAIILVNKVNTSKLVDFLNISQIERKLRMKGAMPKDIEDKLRKLIITTIEG